MKPCKYFTIGVVFVPGSRTLSLNMTLSRPPKFAQASYKAMPLSREGAAPA
jgi:hypothetical protein